MPTKVQHPFRDDLYVVESSQSFGADQPMVYYLLEAFGDTAFDKSMLEVVSHFLDTTHATLICMEGRSGDFGLGLPRSTGNREERVAWAMEQLEKGRLSAAEYLYLATDRGIELWGVEDMRLYDRAFEEVKPLIPRREQWSRIMRALCVDLHRDGLAHLTPHLSDFLQGCCGAKASFVAEFKHVLSHADHLKIDLTCAHHMQRLLATMRLETEIDFGKANQEQDEIVSQITAALADRDGLIVRSFNLADPSLEDATPEAVMQRLRHFDPIDAYLINKRMRRAPLRKLVAWSQRNEAEATVPQTPDDLLALFYGALKELRTEAEQVFADYQRGLAGRRPVETDPRLLELYDYVLDLLVLLDVNDDQCQHFVRNVHYRRRFHCVTAGNLLAEIEAVKEAIVKELSRTDLDRAYARLDKQLDLLGSLLALTPSSSGAAILEEESPSHTELCLALKDLIPKSPALHEFESMREDYDRTYEKTMDYCAVMKARAQAMAENTAARMRDSGRQVALLVTGGFHRDTITAKLSELRVSHAVVLPRWNTTGGGPSQSYFDALQGYS